jgi:UDP-N-acetylmuramoyl-tripeptide--D-alanyl-D-alanine ligase
MSFWTDARVRKALQLSGSADATFPTVSTDSRSIQPGALFVALVGERFDGHAYLEEVAEKGARGAVVSQLPQDAPAALTYYVVPNTLQALGWLGRERRRGLGARVCAVTGSNGKTTTKEMLRAVLGTK